MAISLNQLVRAAQPKPPIMTLYGVHGIGKSTFAAQAPSPVFIQTEDGLGLLDCAHFPLAASFDDVIGALAALYTEPHDFKTCVIDSVDWLEALIWAKVCRDNGWASIEDAGYGKGYVAALNLWRQFLDGLNALRAIRELDPTARVAMLTAMGQQNVVIEAIKAGARDFIVKPFEADRILKSLSKLLM